MPTKTTPAPVQTAAEARALADQLEAQERDLITRRRAARKQAELDAAKAEFNHCDADLAPAREKARARYLAAANADTLDVAELFAAWCEYRVASKVFSTSLATSNAVANTLEPRFGGGGGQVDHRRDFHDLTASVPFTAELDAAIEGHLRRVEQRATDETNARIRAAGEQAEAEIN